MNDTNRIGKGITVPRILVDEPAIVNYRLYGQFKPISDTEFKANPDRSFLDLFANLPTYELITVRSIGGSFDFDPFTGLVSNVRVRKPHRYFPARIDIGDLQKFTAEVYKGDPNLLTNGLLLQYRRKDLSYWDKGHNYYRSELVNGGRAPDEVKAWLHNTIRQNQL